MSPRTWAASPSTCRARRSSTTARSAPSIHAQDVRPCGDPALADLAVIVRGADTDRHDLAPQCAGCSPWRSASRPAMATTITPCCATGLVVYDGLFAWLRARQGASGTTGRARRERDGGRPMGGAARRRRPSRRASPRPPGCGPRWASCRSAARPARSPCCTASSSTSGAGSTSAVSSTRSTTARCCPARRRSSSPPISAGSCTGRAAASWPARSSSSRAPSSCSASRSSTCSGSGVPLVEGLFFGIKAAVLAIVVEAVIRIGRRAMKTCFLSALVGRGLPRLPGAEGAVPARHPRRPASSASLLAHARARMLLALKPASSRRPLEPLAGQPAAGGRRRRRSPGSPCGGRRSRSAALLLGARHILVELGLFFSKLAVVTFGGAYAVLAWLADAAVNAKGWVARRRDDRRPRARRDDAGPDHPGQPVRRLPRRHAGAGAARAARRRHARRAS